jgi:hypothetical protein
LEDERVTAFASPIEYAKRNEDIVDAEDEECGIGVVPILIAGQALYLTAFAVRAGNAPNGYDLLVGNHVL